MFRSLVPVSARYREPRALNSKLSGGLPHSEISGSRPILGSPKLIAEYHVLHRLLLPRHPPNALLALDLIQKKTGFFRWPPPEDGSTDQEHAIPPARTDARTSFTACDEAVWLVYLTWIVSCVAGRTCRPSPTGEDAHDTDVYLYVRCQFIQDWMAKPSALRSSPLNRLVERIGIEPMTPCLQSRCSPS